MAEGGTLIASRSPGQWRLALMENGRAGEFHILRDHRPPVAGAFFWGRVARILPGINAAFVDIGLERAGFLAGADAKWAKGGKDAPIANLLHEGEMLRLQALSDPRPGKGAKLTAALSLAGAFLAFSPTRPGVALSGKITDATARARIKSALDSFARPNEGWVARTRAQDQDAAACMSEADVLRSRWDAVESAFKTAQTAGRIAHENNPLQDFLTERPEITHLICDDAVRARQITQSFPHIKVDIRAMEADLFASLELEDDWHAALAADIALFGGGRIRIEQTAALIAIDVDSGGETGADAAMRANREAAAEIARQIRLRSLAGHIVVDFAGLPRARRKEVRDALAHALSQTFVHETHAGDPPALTPLGLVELTRPRKGAALADMWFEPCGACEMGCVPSVETAALTALRDLLQIWRAPGAAGIPTLRASPPLIALLRGPLMAARHEAESRLGQTIRLAPETRWARNAYDANLERPETGTAP